MNARLLSSVHVQGAVLGFFHDDALFGCLVVYAAEMQYAVDDYAMQFVHVVGAEKFGVAGDCVQGDVGVSGNDAALGVVETDVVGVVVVSNELAVYAQYFLIIDEDVVDVPYAFAV